MTERHPKPSQPREQQGGPATELPLREVYKLPSQAILDGIYTGRIGDPEALRAYFLRQRTEFLQEFPDREHELDVAGPIGRWHGLVHSDTVDEYAGLASFAESEAHRRSARPSNNQAENPAYRQGIANFRRIADAWRQRATRLSAEEPETPFAPEHIDPTLNIAPAVHELAPAAQDRVEIPDYTLMQDYEVLDGISNGTLTETEAVRVYVRKSLHSVRELYEGEELREREADYAEVVYGEPSDMIRFCLGRASEQLSYGLPSTAAGSYEVAARWYAMAGRFGQEAARDRRDEESEIPEES